MSFDNRDIPSAPPWLQAVTPEPTRNESESSRGAGRHVDPDITDDAAEAAAVGRSAGQRPPPPSWLSGEPSPPDRDGRGRSAPAPTPEAPEPSRWVTGPPATVPSPGAGPSEGTSRPSPAPTSPEPVAPAAEAPTGDRPAGDDESSAATGDPSPIETTPIADAITADAAPQPTGPVDGPAPWGPPPGVTGQQPPWDAHGGAPHFGAPPAAAAPFGAGPTFDRPAPGHFAGPPRSDQNGVVQNGFEPNGFAPNGFEPNGPDQNGFVPNGQPPVGGPGFGPPPFEQPPFEQPPFEQHRFEAPPFEQHRPNDQGPSAQFGPPTQFGPPPQFAPAPFEQPGPPPFEPHVPFEQQGPSAPPWESHTNGGPHDAPPQQQWPDPPRPAPGWGAPASPPPISPASDPLGQQTGYPHPDYAHPEQPHQAAPGHGGPGQHDPGRGFGHPGAGQPGFTQPGYSHNGLGAPEGPYGQGQYAYSLDEVALLRKARRAPNSGWRRAVHRMSAGAINPGDSPDDLVYKQLIERVNRPVRGDYKIAVLSLKGGVGKTTTSVGLGSIFASMRGDRVIAVDANPDLGTLAQRIPQQTRSTVRDLLADESIYRYSDVRAHTSQAPSRLEVLASERDPAVAEAFSEHDYRGVMKVLQRFYNIIITDCGTGLSHSAMNGVLDVANALILVSSPAIDGARSAGATLDWLQAHGYGHLVSRAVVVLSSSRSGASTIDTNQLSQHFLTRCRAVQMIPFDDHLAEGAEVDLELLGKGTHRALMELAATVADDFSATTLRRSEPFLQ